jgi:hypothetical protein
MSIRLQQDIKNLREELDRQILANTEKENKVNLFKLSISNKVDENKLLEKRVDDLTSELDILRKDLEIYKEKSQEIIYIKEIIPIENTPLIQLQEKYDAILIEKESYIKTNEVLLNQNNELKEKGCKDEQQIAFQIEQNIILNNENKRIKDNFNVNLNNYKNQITSLQNQIAVSNDLNRVHSNEIQELNDKLIVTTKLAQLYTEYIEEEENKVKNKKKMDKLVNRSIRK